jgi:hypothetical protein
MIMTGLVAFTIFAMCVLASLGLFMSGVASLRQARLAKRMFRLRYPADDTRQSSDSESN